MRHFCIIAVLALTAGAANAELRYQSRPTLCGTLAEIRATVPNETEILRGQLGQNGEGGIVEKWTDPKTGAWSIVQIANPFRACVVIGGYSGMRPVDPKKEGLAL